MEGFHTIYKKRGETLQVLLSRFREETGISEDIPVTYAGRLDPLAEGVMILLSGDMVHEKEKYMGLSKTYTVTILIGFETDTHDILGIPKIYKEESVSIKEYCSSLVIPHTFVQKYPLYSSRTVNGKPLFMYAREGGDVVQPTHEVTLEGITYEKEEVIYGKELLENIVELTNTVQGDFRQEETVHVWTKEIVPNNQYALCTLSLSVSTGFYIRTFVHDMGETLGIPMCVHTLKRKSVGKYTSFE